MLFQNSRLPKAFLAGLFSLALVFFVSKSAQSAEHIVYKDPALYVIQKLKDHDIVFLGTTHKKPAILQFIVDLIPRLKDTGVTHVGIEMPTDHQDDLNSYLNTGTDLMNLYVHPQIDCQEYRNFLNKLHRLRPEKRPSVVALDLPKSMYNKEFSRNEWMAQTIANVFSGEPPAKMLVVVGNFHVFKKIVWQDHVPNKTGSIREYLNGIVPDLKAFSIGQLVDEDPNECDFTRTFGLIKDSVALDCTEGFSDWKIGVTSKIAIKNTEPCKLFDGLIVY